MYYKKISKKQRTYLEVIPNEKQAAFVFRKFIDDKIYDYRHIHNEHEIIYIYKGKGKRNIGDISSTFEEGDICLIGSKIPHYYIIDPVKENKGVEAWVIQFSKDFFGSRFYEYEEIKRIKPLLFNSSNGLTVSDKIRDKIKKLFMDISKQTGIERLITFLRMLDLIAVPGNYELLKGESDVYLVSNDEVEDDRLNAIREYCRKNYMKDIDLQEIASVANLSKSAFCNLFKKHFHTTFSNYINEMRIAKAARYLAESDFTVSDICYKCGFQNTSYFNRKFKKIMDSTPREYRNQTEGVGNVFKPGIVK